MPIYISRGCYTADAVRGMLATPEDREPTIAKVFEKLGGKLLCYYVTLGEFDWLLIAEFPNEQVASSGILVAMAGGSVSDDHSVGERGRGYRTKAAKERGGPRASRSPSR